MRALLVLFLALCSSGAELTGPRGNIQQHRGAGANGEAIELHSQRPPRGGKWRPGSDGTSIESVEGKLYIHGGHVDLKQAALDRVSPDKH